MHKEIVENYRGEIIEVEELVRNGYVSAEDYHKSHE